jgi:hypothetical protein
MFYRLNDFRRVVTRYDKLATNFLAAVQIVAIVSYSYESWPVHVPANRYRVLHHHRAAAGSPFSLQPGPTPSKWPAMAALARALTEPVLGPFSGGSASLGRPASIT